MQRGRAVKSAIEKCIIFGNAIIPLFFCNPSMMMFAALSGCIKNGILNKFLSVKGVLTNPGQITFTLMLSALSAPLKASPHAFTKFFEEE